MKSSFYSRKPLFSYKKSLAAFIAAGSAVLPLCNSVLPARSDAPLPPPIGAAASPPLTRGSGIHVGHKVVLVARPLDSNRVVTAVRFLLDGGTLAECGAPGRWVWDTSTIRGGRHVVQVQAFDHDAFIGLSEPMVVYTGQVVSPSLISPTLEVPFFTYEMDPRRGAAVVAPKIALRPGASISESGDVSSPRLASPLVEVYLNGVKQEFAPAARVASADELTVSKKTADRKTPGSNSRRSRTARQQAEREKAEKKARLARASKVKSQTVWLPARPLLERLGAQVSWQPSSGLLVADLRIAGAARRIVLSARGGGGAVQSEVGGQRVSLTTPVRLAENTIMVPLSFCKDALELRVRWQKADRRVEMFTPITPA